MSGRSIPICRDNIQDYSAKLNLGGDAMTSTQIMSLSNQEALEMLQTLFGRPPEPKLTRETTALMLIDLQYGTCHPDYGLGERAKKLGIFEETMWFWDRLKTTVIPNTQRLLAAARRIGVEVIHVHVASPTRDGRGSGAPIHKTVNMGILKDTVDAQILPEVGPEGDEVILTKVTSSPFDTSIADRVLRNMGIRNLIVVGVVTDGCVEATVRNAAERDYGVIVVEDATASRVQQLHEHAILKQAYSLAVIKSTEEAVHLLEALE